MIHKNEAKEFIVGNENFCYFKCTRFEKIKPVVFKVFSKRQIYFD